MFGQRLDASGAPVGSEFQIFSHDNDEVKNHIAVAPDGSFFVLGWDGGIGLTGRIYDPSGAAVTSEFPVDAAATDYGTVEADPDGNFIVAWNGDTDYGPIQGKRFSNDGTPLGGVFQVSDQPLYTHFQWPELTTDDDGDFVVVWSNGYYYSAGDDSYGVWARRLRVCGNGRVGPDDGCDDGNTSALDGCSATCRVETCHTCSGEPSTCPQLTGCTGVCTDPAPIQPNTAVLTMNGLGAPTGDEGLAFKGKIANPPLAHLEYDPSTEGLELALTTTNLVYGLMGSTRVPPGVVGSGCDPVKDGWRVKTPTFVYRNVSGALPPSCTPGSANGVRVVKLKDKLDRDGTLQFRVKVKNAMITGAPAPPLVATLILGESPAAGAAGRCGQITFTGLIGSRFFP
jgi:cysteine-rich repeat protein